MEGVTRLDRPECLTSTEQSSGWVWDFLGPLTLELRASGVLLLSGVRLPRLTQRE